VVTSVLGPIGTELFAKRLPPVIEGSGLNQQPANAVEVQSGRVLAVE
jgi:hypothetical protein